jgi:hypothetical protein
MVPQIKLKEDEPIIEEKEEYDPNDVNAKWEAM